MDNLKQQLSEHKETLKKTILNAQKILGYLHQINHKKLNNKLIFVKRSLDKVNTAHKHLTSLSLSFASENKDTEIKEALKDTLACMSKLESMLDSRQHELRRSSNLTDTYNYRRDMDSLHLAYNALKNLDTDMTLDEKDLDKKEV